MADKKKTVKVEEKSEDRKRTEFTYGKKKYFENAPKVELVFRVDGKDVQTFKSDARTFKTGSIGYFFNGKVNVPVGDDEVPHQVGCNCIAVGSKEAE